MENTKFLGYLPRWLRSIPNLSAFVVGWITLFGWVLWVASDAHLLPYFEGESGLILFAVIFPIMWLGLTTEYVIAKTIGWNIAAHPVAAKFIAVVITIIMNTLTVWVVLKLLGKVFARIRRNIR